MCGTCGLEVSPRSQLRINKDVGFRWLGLSMIHAQGYRPLPRSSRLAAGASIANFASILSIDCPLASEDTRAGDIRESTLAHPGLTFWIPFRTTKRVNCHFQAGLKSLSFMSEW